jgi:hypothetical protein
MYTRIAEDVGTGGAQEERVLDRYVVECGASAPVRRIQTRVGTRPEHIEVEGQPAHRGARREDLHSVRMGAARVVARGLQVIERLVRVSWMRPDRTQPRIIQC